MAIARQLCDLVIVHGDIRVFGQRGGYAFCKGIAVNCQGTTGRQAVFVGHGHDQPVRRAHFPMQQANGVLFIIVRAERIRAYHFRQMSGAVGKGFDLGAHLVDHDFDAHVGGLPGCL